jgi:hypothetical protein
LIEIEWLYGSKEHIFKTINVILVSCYSFALVQICCIKNFYPLHPKIYAYWFWRSRNRRTSIQWTLSVNSGLYLLTILLAKQQMVRDQANTSADKNPLPLAWSAGNYGSKATSTTTTQYIRVQPSKTLILHIT